MRSKLLATAIVLAALALGTSAFATSSNSQGNDDDQGYSLQLGGGSSFNLLSFLTPPSGGWGDYAQIITNTLNAFRSGRMYGGFDGPGHGPWHTKPPRDAGYVPEPGAVGVFSVGLLMAGALIRRLSRKG